MIRYMGTNISAFITPKGPYSSNKNCKFETETQNYEKKKKLEWKYVDLNSHWKIEAICYNTQNMLPKPLKRKTKTVRT